MIKRYSVAANRYVIICLVNEPHFKFLWDDEIAERRRSARKPMGVIGAILCSCCPPQRDFFDPPRRKE